MTADIRELVRVSFGNTIFNTRGEVSIHDCEFAFNTLLQLTACVVSKNADAVVVLCPLPVLLSPVFQKNVLEAPCGWIICLVDILVCPVARSDPAVRCKAIHRSFVHIGFILIYVGMKSYETS